MSGGGEEERDVLVVPPSCGNRTEDVDAFINKVEALSQTNTPFHVTLCICLCVGSIVEGLGALDDSCGVGGEGFLGT